MCATRREISVEEVFSSDGREERRQKFLDGRARAFCRGESCDAVEYTPKKVEMSDRL